MRKQNVPKQDKEKSRAKKLKLNKQTVKDLDTAGSRAEKIKGGATPSREGVIRCN